jgi:hypothetical protein
MEFTLAYLPRLKETFTKKLGEIHKTKLVLIEYAFSNYKLLLIHSMNDASIPVEFAAEFTALNEKKHIQLTALALFHREIMVTIRKGCFNEIDKNLLVDIFMYYKESMLHFKEDREEFKLVKSIIAQQ